MNWRALCPRRGSWDHHTRGQAIVLLLAMLVAMVSMALWLLNSHKAILARLRAQDTGDPTVLAAAKWQAAGLNLIGELNLIHAYMLADSEENEPDALALHELQQRISLAVPVLALQAAQHVAEINNAQPIPDARDFLLDCAHFLEFPNLYEGASADFRQMLEAVLDAEEIYTYPLYPISPTANSLLAHQDFYEAVLADDYCWFWFNAYSFLTSYRNYRDFGPVPEISTRIFFNLDVATVWYPLATLRNTPSRIDPNTTNESTMNEQLRALGHPTLPPPLPPDAEEGSLAASEQFVSHPWMVYGTLWREWTEIRRTTLPVRADVRPEFDVLGAYAAISVLRDQYPWMAAAKPFGSVGGEPPLQYDLLLGGFNTVRLVPIDALEAGIRPFDLKWFRHVYFHVQPYSRNGFYVSECRYCRALQKWDRSNFRAAAAAWLALHGHTCRRPKIGRGDAGGSHYAH